MRRAGRADNSRLIVGSSARDGREGRVDDSRSMAAGEMVGRSRQVRPYPDRLGQGLVAGRGIELRSMRFAHGSFAFAQDEGGVGVGEDVGGKQAVR